MAGDDGISEAEALRRLHAYAKRVAGETSDPKQKLENSTSPASKVSASAKPGFWRRLLSGDSAPKQPSATKPTTDTVLVGWQLVRQQTKQELWAQMGTTKRPLTRLEFYDEIWLSSNGRLVAVDVETEYNFVSTLNWVRCKNVRDATARDLRQPDYKYKVKSFPTSGAEMEHIEYQRGGPWTDKPYLGVSSRLHKLLG